MDAFTAKVLLSVVIEAIWVAGATIVAERVGPKTGGTIGMLPTHIVVSLLFIGLTQNALFAAESAKMVPLTMMINSLFLFSYIALAPRIKQWAVPASIAFWFAASTLLGFSGIKEMWGGIVIYGLVTLTCFFLVKYKMNVPIMGKRNVKYTIPTLAFRATLAGAIVATAVILAAVGGPVWGGIFAIFPAIMLGNIVILTRSQGIPFTRYTVKVMLPAASDIIVFAVGVYFFYPLFDVLGGTILAYMLAISYAIFMYPYIRRYEYKKWGTEAAKPSYSQRRAKALRRTRRYT